MTLKEWKLEVHERECYKCKICGSSYDLTVHHKIPVARGGKSNKENCICWCSDCHRAYHCRWGLTISDDFGNPMGEFRGTNRPSKRKHKKHCNHRK